VSDVLLGFCSTPGAVIVGGVARCAFACGGICMLVKMVVVVVVIGVRKLEVVCTYSLRCRARKM
jgi:hypothetical protein